MDYQTAHMKAVYVWKSLVLCLVFIVGWLVLSPQKAYVQCTTCLSSWYVCGTMCCIGAGCPSSACGAYTCARYPVYGCDHTSGWVAAMFGESSCTTYNSLNQRISVET